MLIYYLILQSVFDLFAARCLPWRIANGTGSFVSPRRIVLLRCFGRPAAQCAILLAGSIKALMLLAFEKASVCFSAFCVRQCARMAMGQAKGTAWRQRYSHA
ncbi:hypothetical protein NPIL_371431 [Nephila pilipes]|uniref:Uncharacterized protein n=1 Tax=Nephila pilipes TaxID=299642 RepID=A0A8X6PCS9_NEPPI|nr:hypothetical protein NPIL_371431 [Nephila pilipes]